MVEVPTLGVAPYDPSRDPVHSSYVAFSGGLLIQIPISVSHSTGRSVTLQSMTGETNFAGSINLSDQVVGIQVASGESIVVVTLEGTFNFLERTNYTISLAADGITDSGEYCGGYLNESFEAGHDYFTQSPTLSPVQYTNDTGPCSISTEISSTLRFGKPPNSTICTEGFPSALWFRYMGNLCNSSDYQGRKTTCVDFATPDYVYPYVLLQIDDVTNNETVFYYDFFDIGHPAPARVPLDLFQAGGKPTETLRITLSHLVEEVPGVPDYVTLQVVELGTSCNDDDIRLMTHYGRFQLIGFETPSQGQQIGIDYAEIFLTTSNTGDGPLNITSFLRKDLATGEEWHGILHYDWWQSLTWMASGEDAENWYDEIPLAPGQSETLTWTTKHVDLVDFDPEEQLFIVNVEAKNTLNGLSCNTSTLLTLSY